MILILQKLSHTEKTEHLILGLTTRYITETHNDDDANITQEAHLVYGCSIGLTQGISSAILSKGCQRQRVARQPLFAIDTVVLRELT